MEIFSPKLYLLERLSKFVSKEKLQEAARVVTTLAGSWNLRSLDLGIKFFRQDPLTASQIAKNLPPPLEDDPDPLWVWERQVSNQDHSEAEAEAEAEWEEEWERLRERLPLRLQERLLSLVERAKYESLPILVKKRRTAIRWARRLEALESMRIKGRVLRSWVARTLCNRPSDLGSLHTFYTLYVEALTREMKAKSEDRRPLFVPFVSRVRRSNQLLIATEILRKKKNGKPLTRTEWRVLYKTGLRFARFYEIPGIPTDVPISLPWPRSRSDAGRCEVLVFNMLFNLTCQRPELRWLWRDWWPLVKRFYREFK